MIHRHLSHPIPKPGQPNISLPKNWPWFTLDFHSCVQRRYPSRKGMFEKEEEKKKHGCHISVVTQLEATQTCERWTVCACHPSRWMCVSKTEAETRAKCSSSWCPPGGRVAVFTATTTREGKREMPIVRGTSRWLACGLDLSLKMPDFTVYNILHGGYGYRNWHH